MKIKFLAAAGVLAFGLISVPCASAGTEVIQDYGGREVAPRYNYAPRPIYYAPPPIGVAVYPRVGYYHRPVRFYRFHRPYRGYRHWR